MPEPAPVTMDQVGCARCLGRGHDNITFVPLTHPVAAGEYLFTHWAPCPANGEPILLTFRVTELDVPAGLPPVAPIEVATDG